MRTIYRIEGYAVGILEGDIFFPQLKRSRDFDPNAHAWLIRKDTLLKAQENGAGIVIIQDPETGWLYQAKLRHLLEKGILLQKGSTVLLRLPVELWEVSHALA